MFKTISLLATFFAFFLISSTSFSQSEEPTLYVFKGDLPPVRLTFSDLEQFLVDLEHIQNSVSGDSKRDLKCSYEITGSKMAVSGPAIEQVFRDPRLPAYANEFRLSCRPRSLIIPSISMTLSTYSRWEVSGTDRVLLESVRSHFEDFGNEHSTYLGGLTAQILFILVFSQIFFFSPQFLANRILPCETRRKYDQWIFPISLLLSILVTMSLIIFAVPARMFPTVAIYRGTASVLERYSPEIGFWGLIISLSLAILFWRRPVAIVAPKVEAPPSPQKNQDLTPKV